MTNKTTVNVCTGITIFIWGLYLAGRLTIGGLCESPKLVARDHRTPGLPPANLVLLTLFPFFRQCIGEIDMLGENGHTEQARAANVLPDSLQLSYGK